MRLATFFIVLALFALWSLGDPSAQAPAENQDPQVAIKVAGSPIEVIISAKTQVIKPGEDLPQIRAQIKNIAATPVTVIQPLDGCDVGWRMVDYEWIVTDAAGQPVKRQKISRCGNTNPVIKEDFVKLQPGEAYTIEPEKTFLSNVGAFYKLSTPGVYKVSLRYRYDPERDDENPGKNPIAGKREDRAIKADVNSNLLTIEVKE